MMYGVINLYQHAGIEKDNFSLICTRSDGHVLTKIQMHVHRPVGFFCAGIQCWIVIMINRF